MPECLHVLGTPLLVTDYDGLAAHCRQWCLLPRTTAVEFSNTHIVTLRRTDPVFRTLTSVYDWFVPDASPLFWCLRLAGARLPDRVYGPTFMGRFLRAGGNASTHYLLGGTEEVGRRLKLIFEGLNPTVRFVGSFHGKCSPDGFLEGAAEAEVPAEINQLSPDFIWVCFGAPKQELWVARHKHMLQRGVLLTVGFALDVNAGTKRDAPAWMQRAGLTWLFRMAAEPRRLGPRFLRFNTLFLWYLMRDGLRHRAWGQQQVS